MPTASLRAPEGYHLPKVMEKSQASHPDLFDKFGGHPCAAGFGITTTNLPFAKKLMGKFVEEQSDNLGSTNSSYCNIEIPSELQSLTYRKEIIWTKTSLITKELLDEIIALDPFGQDFALPNLAFEVDFFDTKKVRWLGQEAKHFKIELPNSINLTFFNIDQELKSFANSTSTSKLWVIAKPIVNAWKGSVKVELIVDKWWVIG